MKHLRHSLAGNILLKAYDLSEKKAHASRASWAQLDGFRSVPDAAFYALYAVALAVSISTWFLAIRAPLWLDETISFFIIKGGFSEIISRQGWPGVPAYPYLLWLWVKAVGTGEVALRISSVLGHAWSGLSAVPLRTGTVRVGCCLHRRYGLLPSSDR